MFLDSNANFKSIDGVLFGKTGEWIIAFPGGKTGIYTVPETTKGIADTHLQERTFPRSYLVIMYTRYAEGHFKRVI